MAEPWQTCNCIGDWHYNTNVYKHGYRTANNLVKQLVDIVSKNGNLLLNIPLRADGTYDDKAAQFLDELEAWMTPNGESIFGTRPWVKFGEGPVAEKTIAINAQGFNEGQYNGMDYRDIRFNQTKKYLYATAMGWPADGKLVIKSLAKGTLHAEGIQCVGSKFVLWRRSETLAKKTGTAKARIKVNPVRAGAQKRRAAAKAERERKNEYFKQAAIEQIKQRRRAEQESDE